MTRNTTVFLNYNPFPSKGFLPRIVKSHFQPIVLTTVCFKSKGFGNCLVNLYFKGHIYMSTLIVHMIKVFICIEHDLLKMTTYAQKKHLTNKYNKKSVNEWALVVEPF